MRSLYLVLLPILYVYADNPQILPYCAPKFFDGPELSFVCVCNSTYCDEVETPGVLSYTDAMIYTSSVAGDRLLRHTITFDTIANSSNIISVDGSIEYQTIHGFGAAVTDSAAQVVQQLSQPAYLRAMQSYFTLKGTEYSLLRLPMGSTPFSSRVYSYDDVADDFALHNFSLTDEDTKYRIPFLSLANNLTNVDLRSIAVPFSAPGWMKDNGKMTGGGSLKGPYMGKYYKAWAKYFVEYAAAYHRAGLPLWALSIQETPSKAEDNAKKAEESMMMNTTTTRDFILSHLGPMLRNHSTTHKLKLFAMEETREFAPMWADSMFSDANTSAYVDGLGVHWYTDKRTPVSNLNNVHKKYPKKMVMVTEASTGYEGYDTTIGPSMGSWQRADDYMTDIIQNLNNHANGWIDGNAFLDTSGGPSRTGERADAAIIVNATADEFYKQPMYYAIGHFSKFVQPGCKRVHVELPQGIQGVAFTSGGGHVLVVQNKKKQAVDLSMTETGREGQFMNFRIEPRSFVTLVWNAPY